MGTSARVVTLTAARQMRGTAQSQYDQSLEFICVLAYGCMLSMIESNRGATGRQERRKDLVWPTSAHEADVDVRLAVQTG
jgi:hypothetical protein